MIASSDTPGEDEISKTPLMHITSSESETISLPCLEVDEMLSIQKLLNKEMPVIQPQAQRKVKIRKEIYLCKACGHLYYYRIIKCPLCESPAVRKVTP